jgi:hypothetical protein
MTILKRLVIAGHTVSIVETENTIEVECPKHIERQVHAYLEDEGIMEEVLADRFLK